MKTNSLCNIYIQHSFEKHDYQYVCTLMWHTFIPEGEEHGHTDNMLKYI